MLLANSFLRHSAALAIWATAAVLDASGQSRRPESVVSDPSDRVYFASSCRVGEVSQDSAIIWTRLTLEPERRWNGVTPMPLMSPPRVISESPDLPATEWEGAVPGAAGQVRLRVSKSPEFRDDAILTDWRSVEASTDFATKFVMQELQPHMRYYYVAEGRAHDSAPTARSIVGTFRTAPNVDEWEDVWFAVITCQMYYQRDERDG